MMVLFTSQSDKKARKTVAKILDSFADRIGTDVWQTLITKQGLETVKLLLRSQATKSMSVSCRWMRSRHQSELLWIVGDRSRFNEEGCVPVHTTEKDILHSDWENHWRYLPQIKALAALAGVLHDWGKANDAFQQKLKQGKKTGDAYRHEWLSCMLIIALVIYEEPTETVDDSSWLARLAKADYEENILRKRMQQVLACTKQRKTWREVIDKIPPIANLICWLILTHHKMPVTDDKDMVNDIKSLPRNTWEKIFSSLSAEWGYRNDLIADVAVKFSQGLLYKDSVWQKQVKKWSERLSECQQSIQDLWKKDAVRPLLYYARLCLMMADYQVSAQETTHKQKIDEKKTLFANRDKQGLKQTLTEHLVGVSNQAARYANLLPRMVKQESLQDVRSLRKKSPSAFAWQDKAKAAIQAIQQESVRDKRENIGYFVVNMASTGCGKTIANAKIMQAIAGKEGIRYSLLLGLRTLTLQTGEAYRENIGLSRADMAVCIGSQVIKELYDETAAKESVEEGIVKSADSLGFAEVDGEALPADDVLEDFGKIFSEKVGQKQQVLLRTPIVVATIDQLMPASEAIRGGRYMIPFLRLLSADVVIDEVDAFNREDLPAIARLVYLVGLCGRNLTLSSATLAPDLIAGLFAAYQEGRRQYAQFFEENLWIAGMWCDEFTARHKIFADGETMKKEFFKTHQAFVEKRVKKLSQQTIKRYGRIISCGELLEMEDIAEREQAYFETMKEAMLTLHTENSLQDEETGKKFSIGVVRMANVQPCIRLGKYLETAELPENIAIRFMVYHSQQLLLLRHRQEQYLDRVLTRKGEWQETVPVKDAILREHFAKIKAQQVIFIVLTTPVEEVGRDHDFDWAVIEPSSYRSIVQLAGRVLRHRRKNGEAKHANIGIMQYNYKGIVSKRAVAFQKPGYEERRAKYLLKTHDVAKLLQKNPITERVDSVPCILKPNPLESTQSLADLEHQAMQDFADFTAEGAESLAGWLTEKWWLTGMCQRISPFRKSVEQVDLCLWQENGEWKFFQKDEHTGEWVSTKGKYDIAYAEKEEQEERFWLLRDYFTQLQEIAMKKAKQDVNDIETTEKVMQSAAHRYGILSFACYDGTRENRYEYSDQYGLIKLKGD